MTSPPRKMNKETIVVQKRNRIRLYFAVFTVNLMYFSTCVSYVWTSPTLIYLMSEESHISITEYEGSWIASLITLGGMFGAPLTTLFLDTVGRKWTLELCVVVIIVSWVWLAIASTVVELYAARFFAGFATGLSYSVAPIYTAEISEDSLRGALNTIPLVSRSLGYFFTYSVGPYLSYYQLIAVSLVSPLLCLVLFPLTPESPYHLVAKSQHQKAAEAIHWLRGGITDTAVDKELNVIQESIAKSRKNKQSYKDLFSSSGNIRALCLSSGFLSFQQFCGVTAILLYTEPIFNMAKTSIPSSLSAILVGGVMVISSCIGPTLTKNSGFVKPVIVSSAGLALFLGTLGLYFFLADNGYDVSMLYWMPVASLLLYCFSYSLGMGSVPWAVMGEVFPANIKALAAGSLTAYNFFLGFIISILFPQMISVLGRCSTFWLYGVFCLLAIPFTIYLLPDTRGMSLDEIQTVLNKRQTKVKREIEECVSVV